MNGSHKSTETEKERKQNAILDAAASSIALYGMGVPTAEIAKRACVSKGALFLHFSSKDELFRQLHQCLENDLAALLAAEYPADASIERQFRHVWECYIDWAWRAQARHRALRQLEMSSRLRNVSRETALFSAIDGVTSTVNQYHISGDRTATFLFLCNVMESIATTVLDMMATDPGGFDDFKSLGWITFWGAASACITLGDSI